jgi:hypothetical protein
LWYLIYFFHFNDDSYNTTVQILLSFFFFNIIYLSYIKEINNLQVLNWWSGYSIKSTDSKVRCSHRQLEWNVRDLEKMEPTDQNPKITPNIKHNSTSAYIQIYSGTCFDFFFFFFFFFVYKFNNVYRIICKNKTYIWIIF